MLHVRQPMRFCFDARTAQGHFPGVGRYAINLARAMSSALAPGEELTVLYDPSAPPALAGVELAALPVSVFSWMQHLRVPRELRRRRVALYHSPYFLIPARPGVPTVVSIHDLIPLRYPQYFGTGQRLLYNVSIRIAARAAARVIAASQDAANDVTRYLGVEPGRIAVIPMAADPAFLPAPNAVVDELRVRLRLPERYVLYVGTNRPHKNLTRLVEAWALLQPRPDSLVIAGPWDARYPEARRRVEELGLGDRVCFAGAVDEADLPALYAGARLFVFPSECEGFGLPVIEAMACGTPVACSDVPSLAELAGDTALFFSPHSTESIATTLGRLLDDAALRADLSRRGLARAAQFTWEDAARRTLELYRGAV
jgi:alpha-1,3-rhamnosyl/mannosyltransferase